MAAPLSGGIAGEGAPPTGSSPPRRRRGRLRDVAAMAPFCGYTIVFLIVPAVVVALGAFQAPSGGLTWSNLTTATSGVYATGIKNSIELSLLTAIVPAVFGTLIAYAIYVGRPESLLRRAVVTASGVFGQFGGVPLAFLFIASFNPYGLATSWLAAIGINLSSLGFNLYTFGGVALVYLYFQIPLMVLIVLPAFGGLRQTWKEATRNLGGSTWRYWRHVALPALAPTILGCLLVLFGSALSAYATADALTSGSIALSPIQIGSFLNGNVLAGQQNVGKAIGLLMLALLAVVMLAYSLLQRKVSRWLR